MVVSGWADNVRYAPLIVVISHITAVFGLTCSICVGLYRSHTALRPSQDTRLRISKRRKATLIFAALAVVSLATSIYHATNYVVLSYNVWAGERGVVPLNRLGHDDVVQTLRLAKLTRSPARFDALRNHISRILECGLRTFPSTGMPSRS